MALSPDASRHLAALDHIVNHEELVKALDSGGLWSVGLASDSIVVATPLHEYGETVRDVVRLLAGVVARLQVRLMQRGFFLRGALAIGDLHFYGNLCFGPALVEAVIAEKTYARHPRIVLCPPVEDLLNEAHHAPGDAIGGLVAREGNEVMFVDYLELLGGEPSDQSEARLSAHKQIVELRLAGYRDTPKLRSKYEWLAAYHNGFCNFHMFDAGKLCIADIPALDYRPLVTYRQADPATERLSFDDVFIAPRL